MKVFILATLLLFNLSATARESSYTIKGFMATEEQILNFVQSNQSDLIREMERGYGDKLSTFASLNGCMDDVRITAFNSKARTDFQNIVPDRSISSVDLVQNLKTSGLSNFCNR